MKLRANNEEVEIIGLDQVQSIDFGIRDEDQGMILEFLRSKMYEDPIGSICREIACNSRDANREAGRGSKPIVISIDESGYYSEGETTISFIDSGVGISPERMGEIFCNYGASTKRTSNKLTGGFGLGAKTPFSYSDVFFVETIFEHIKYVYQATLDGKNGKMILLNQEECKDRNGTSITIPIKDKDRNTFENGCKYYTQYWKIKPNFQNFRSYHTGVTTFNTYETFSIYSKDGGIGNLFLLIDEIPYPLNEKMFKEELNMNAYSNYSIGLDFPNGELSVSVNRETLYYDEHTIKKIKKRILKVKEECKTLIQEYIETKESRWEAYKVMLNVDSHFSFFKIIKMEIEYNNTYKGDKLIDPRTSLKNFIQKDYIHVKMTTHSGYMNSGQSIRNYITKDDNYHHFDLSPTGNVDKILFIIMDGRRDYKKDHYIASLIDEQGYKIYIWKDFQMNVWRRDVYNQFDRFMEAMDFYGFNWINYSDIPQANIKKASDKKEKSQELKYICLDINGGKVDYIITDHDTRNYERVRASYEFDKVVIDKPFQDKEFFYMVVDKFTEVGAYKADHTNKELKKLCNINYQLRDVENTGKKRYISKTDFPFVILIKKKDEQYFINNPNAIPFESLLKCEEYRQFRLDRTLKRQIGEVFDGLKKIPSAATALYNVSNDTILKFFSLFDIEDKELKEFLNTVNYLALPDLKSSEEDLSTTVEQSLRVYKLKEFVKDKIQNKTVQAYYLLFINSDEDDTETRDFLIEKLKNI